VDVPPQLHAAARELAPHTAHHLQQQRLHRQGKQRQQQQECVMSAAPMPPRGIKTHAYVMSTSTAN
jgi:hypothetical protein